MNPSSRRTVLIGLAAAASGHAFAADRTVHGSGHSGTDKRALSGFDRIAISGSFQVEIHQGTQEGLELIGDDNLLALVETKVEGSPGSATLRIRAAGDTQLDPTRPIRVRIDLIRIAAIDLGGSSRVTAPGLHAARLGVSIGGTGSVDLTGLDAGRLAVNIGGSGHASADGKASTLAINIGGSGDCSLPRLIAEEAKIDIAGSGKAEVNVSRQLRVSIAGSGHVRYAGTAVPSVSIVGSGKVERG
ncbi:MAG: head GIN domain-containing protein [Caldimonas sp.]|nr:DUF2807 domain-containing protein [Pseudomonadota bacterium]